MRCVIMANGHYGDARYYQKLLADADVVLCADGGANYAYKMNIVPACIMGDMDSIEPQVKEYYEKLGVAFKEYPCRKDFTDTQLILASAQEMGATEIIFVGSLGDRLDHTLANLYCGAGFALKGRKVWHYSPGCCVYLVNREIILHGNIGDIVSVLALTEQASGVYEEGFEYPLADVVLNKWNPYAISNVLGANVGIIRVNEGLLLVFHYCGGVAG